MEILQVKNLTFKYAQSQNCAVDNVSFNIKQGEFVVLCGESGCGKSTLLRLLKREIAPYGEQSGEILYRGESQQKLDERIVASEIGFVYQNPENQIVADKVWHELAFGLENMGYPSNVIRLRVAEMASYFGIEEWFQKNTAELSGGQKQMLNLASVMVMQPRVLLLDEPTAQLDPIAAANFIGTLQKLNRELGLTILLVEHCLEEALPIADRVFLMNAGRIVYMDKPRDISTYFRSDTHSPMLYGMPTAMRIYNALNLDKECPLSVKEGHELVTENFDNRIATLEEKQGVCRDKAVLELQDVWFRYEKKLSDVLKGTSLSVFESENLCILGGNGTGKSTVLKVLSGLLRAYRGKVKIYGKDISKYSKTELYHHNIAMLPQNPQTVFLEKTVREDFLEICKAMEYKKDEYEGRISEVSEITGITQLLDIHPYDLSGGEQQKAALAKMLLLQPKLLLLDEPSKGIDAGAKLVLGEILRKLKEDGITIVTVTHDVEFAAANGDRCAMLFDGEIVSIDTPREFFSDNNFYTTAANRIARGHYQKAILCEDVVKLCRLNGRREA